MPTVWIAHAWYIAAAAMMAFVKLVAVFGGYYFGSLLLWERIFGNLIRDYKTAAVLAVLWIGLAIFCIMWIIATAFDSVYLPG